MPTEAGERAPKQENLRKKVFFAVSESICDFFDHPMQIKG
jgi:hypothetical protein